MGTVTQPAPVTEEPVTPSFSIKSSIWNYADTQVVTSGVVSEELRWKIIGPGKFGGTISFTSHVKRFPTTW